MVPTAEARKGLPEALKSRLLEGDFFSGGVFAEASDHELISALDEHFQIGLTTAFGKVRHAEVDQKELARFSHYCIHAHMLEPNSSLFYEESRPVCDHETCPWGAKRITPMRVHPKRAAKIGIAEVGHIWEMQIDLIQSQEVKELFEREHISGLSYEPCELGTAKRLAPEQYPKLFLARIEPRTHFSAEAIVLPREYCERHQTVHLEDVLCRSIPRSRLGDWDFQMISSVRVPGEEYFFYKPWWVVSRRALQLLLDHKVTGLQTATWILKEKFYPLITSDD